MTQPQPPDVPPPPGTVPPPEQPGGDPWMPARLAALAFLLAGEAELFGLYTDLLKGWFAAIRPRVVNPVAKTVDPLGVYAAEPAFKAGLRRFLGGVREVFRRTYADVLDADLEDEVDSEVIDSIIDSEPAVRQYLAEVENKMVRTPDEVFSLIRAEVDQGVDAGDSIPEIAERIDLILLNTGTERWQNRATTVARTETVGAYNAGSYSAYAGLGIELEKIWLATMDARTRDSHFAADGQRVGLTEMFQVGGFPGLHPGAKSLPAHECINCRCTFVVVEPGETEDVSGRGWKAEDVTMAEVRRRAARGIVRARDGR